MKKALLIILSTFLINQITAQCVTLNSKESFEIIKNGIKLHDEEKYQLAIDEFKKIDKNDSSYYLAQIELVNTLQAFNQDSLAITICDNIIDNYEIYRPNAILFKSNCLDNLNKFDEAVENYEKGIKMYPRNYNFIYELGVAYFKKEKYLEAYKLFTQTIKMNPYYAPAHLQLANLAYRQGNIIGAVLAYEYFLINENKTKRSQNVVSFIESLVKGESDYKTKITLEGYTELNDFSELESLVKSKVALSKKYKSRIDLNYDLTKQLQLISEKLVFNKKDTGFYMQFYGKFFSELESKKFFEPFIYHVFKGMQIQAIDKWVEKNDKSLEKFTSWAVTYIQENSSYYEDEINGEKDKMNHFYSKNSLVALSKDKSPTTNKNGLWYYFFDNGNLKSYGNHVNNLKEGEWKYFYLNGNIKEISNYKNGKLHGPVQENFENGITKTKLNYNMGMLDGNQEVYYQNGNIKGFYVFKNDKREGKEIEYFDNKVIRYETQYVDGKINGEYKEFYNSGNVNQVFDFIDGQKVGKYIAYFDSENKLIKKEGLLNKSNESGEWKYYNKQQILVQSGVFENGNKIGLWKSFYDNGKLKFEENYNNDGKLNGVYKFYSENGTLTEEFLYKNDLLTEYKQYDDSGKKLAEGNRDKKKIDVKMFYPNGNIKKQGLLENNKATGEWQFYDYNGVLTSKYSYMNGDYEGVGYEYYGNQKIKNELNYKAGKAEGCYKEYYVNGNILETGMYVNDEKEGYWNEYTINNVLKSSNYYKNGKLIGEQKYFSSKGILESIEYIDNNNLKYKISYYDTLGKYKFSYYYSTGELQKFTKLQNGATRLKYTINNNIINDSLFRFFPNGKVEEVMIYKNGLRHGESRLYDVFGNLKEISNYVNDKLEGENIKYYENGKIKRACNFENGKINGIVKYFHENGKLQRESIFKDGKLHGPSLNYDDTGNLMAKRNYYEDHLVSYEYLDLAGKFIKPIVILNGNIDVKCYYQNGKPSLTYAIKNGELTGFRKEFHSNGNLMSVEEFECGYNIGPEKIYHSNGKLKTLITYKFGEKEGEYSEHYENGKLKYIANYVADDKYGDAIYYDEKGQIIKTVKFYNDIAHDIK